MTGEPDPFFITGPAVISFSGGRTSAYMLHRIVQAHGGALPADVLVCFANTGEEAPATLDFVRDCAEAWGVHVRWLEYRHQPPTEDEAAAWRAERLSSLSARLERAKSPEVQARLRARLAKAATATAPGRVWAEEVGHNSASRGGEPFDMLVRARRFLPNPVSRFCTTELKIRTIRRWCVQTFGARTTWTQVVGLRADEPARVERIMDPARQAKAGREARQVVVPLHAAGVTKADVLAFWRAQPFDLRLRGEWEGNCNGCMLKRKSFIGRLWRDDPVAFARWEAREAHAARFTAGRGARFRKDWKGGYAAIREAQMASPRLPDVDPDDDGLSPFVTDCATAGCGI